MAERIVTWRAVADFSKVRKEAAETQASLASLQTQIKKNNAEQSNFGSLEAGVATKVSSANRELTKSYGDLGGAQKTEAAASREGTIASRAAASAHEVEQSKLSGLLDRVDALAKKRHQVTVAAQSATRADYEAISALNRQKAAYDSVNAATSAKEAALRKQGVAERQYAAAVVNSERALRDFGEGSDQASKAQNKLTSARDKAATASERVVSATNKERSAIDRSGIAAISTSAHIEKLRNSVEKTDRELRVAEGGGGGFTRALLGIGAAFEEGSGKGTNFYHAMRNIRFPILISGAVEFASALSSIVSGLFAVASAAGPALGTLAAIGPLAVAAGTAFGTVKAAFGGVGNALKLYGTAQTQAGVATYKAADATQKAAKVSQHSAEQEAKADATRANNAQAVKTAQLALANARKNVGATEKTVAAQVVKASQNITAAEQKETDAQRAVTAARAAAITNINALKQAVIDAANAEADSTLSLEQAKQDLQRTLDDPTSTDLQRRQAAQAVKDAEAQASADKVAAKTAVSASKAATAAGVEGSAGVVKAKENEQKAQLAVANAHVAYTKTVTDGNNKIAKSHAAVAAAQVKLVKAQRTQSVEAKPQAVTDGSGAGAVSIPGAAGAATAADNYREALAKLSPAARAFVLQLIAMQKYVTKIKAVAAANLLPGLTVALKELIPIFPAVTADVALMGKALGDLAIKAGKLFSSPAWIQSLKIFGPASVKLVTIFGDAFLHLLDAFRAVSVAAIPMTIDIAKATDGIAKHLDKLATAPGAYDRMATFFAKAWKTAKQLGAILSNIGGILYNVGRASSATGQGLIDDFQKATKQLENFTGSKKGQADLKKFFVQIGVNVRAVSGLLVDLAKLFLGAGASKNLAPIIAIIRTQLLPAIKKLIDGFGKAFGPSLIKIISNLANIFGTLAGQSGALSGFVSVITDFTTALSWFVKFPGAASLIGGVAAALAAFSAINLIAKVSGVTKMATALGQFALGAGRAKKAAEEAGGAASLGQKILGGVGGIGVSRKAANTAIRAGEDVPTGGLGKTVSAATSGGGLLKKALQYTGVLPGVKLGSKAAKDAKEIDDATKATKYIPKHGEEKAATGVLGKVNNVRKALPSFGDVIPFLGKNKKSLEKDGEDAGKSFASGLASSGVLGKIKGGFSSIGGVVSSGMSALTGILKGGGGAAAGEEAAAGGFALFPWGLIVVALILAIVLIIKYWKQIKDFVIKAAKAVYNAIKGPFNDILSFFKKWGPLLFIAASLAFGPIGLVLALLILTVVKHWNAVKNVFTAAIGYIGSFIKKYWPLLLAPLTSGLSLLIPFIIKHWSAIKSIFTGAMSAIGRFIAADWHIYIQPVVDAVEKLISPITSHWKSIKKVFTDSFSSIGKALSSFVSGIGTVWNGLGDALTGPVKYVVNTIIDDWIIGNIDKVLDFFGVPQIPKLAKIGGSSKSYGANPSKSTGYSASAGYATGGKVPGTGNQDTVPAMLTPGEFVIRKGAVKAIGLHNLHALNKADHAAAPQYGPGGQHLSIGGIVHGALGGVSKAGKFAWDHSGKLAVKGVEKLGSMAADYARKGAAYALEKALSPVKSALGSTLGTKGFNGMLTTAGDSMVDAAVSYVRGVDSAQKAAVPTGVSGGVAPTGHNVSDIWANLLAQGWGPIASAGIMGNMQSESGFNPFIIQGGGTSMNPADAGGGGYGLVQWTPGRKLIPLLDGATPSITSEVQALTRQLRGGSESSAGNALKGAKSPGEAATIFGLKYERYAGGVQGARSSQAEAIYNKYATSAAAGPSKTGGYSASAGYNKGGLVQNFHAGGPVAGLKLGANSRIVEALRFQLNDKHGLTDRLWDLGFQSEVNAKFPTHSKGYPISNAIGMAGQLLSKNPSSYATQASDLKLNFSTPETIFAEHPNIMKDYLGTRPNKALAAAKNSRNPSAIKAAAQQVAIGKKQYTMLLQAYNEEGDNMSYLRQFMKQPGGNKYPWGPSLDAPVAHLLDHGLGKTHAANLPHPWSGPVTAGENATAEQDRSNALNTQFYGYLNQIADWGLTDLVSYLLDKGVADGLQIAKSAAASKTEATALNKSIHAGKTGFGGLSTDDQASVLKMTAKLASGSSAHPFGLRDVAETLQVPDYGVVNLYDQAQASLKTVSAGLLTKFNSDVSLFRKGLFYAATGGKVPGHGNGDTVPAMLTPGEFVIKKKAAQALGLGTLHEINNIDSSQHLATGGMVLAPNITSPALSSRSSRVTAKIQSSGNNANGAPSYVTNIDTTINVPQYEPSAYEVSKNLRRLASTGMINRAARDNS